MSPFILTLFSWCSGYHICLTRRRSPVRSRAKTYTIPCGLVARIAGFHPAGPGSIPGMGNNFFESSISFFQVQSQSTKLIKDFKIPNVCQRLVIWKGLSDEVAEWLRRWTANPMGSARVGSNPILVEIFAIFPCACSFYLPFRVRSSFHSWSTGCGLKFCQSRPLPSPLRQTGGEKNSYSVKREKKKMVSVTGNRTRATWVRARYPNH